MNQEFIAAKLSSFMSGEGREQLDSEIVLRPQELAGEGKTAAVLLLIFANPESNQPTIVLTVRRHNLNHHAGQVSLPGGRQELGESLRATALREAQEEIGVDTDQIQLLGRLGPVYVPPSDFTIYPFVGWYSGTRFIKSDDEVAEILLIPVEFLTSNLSMSRGPILSETRKIVAEFYPVGSHQVWGATAKILAQFGSILNGKRQQTQS